MTKDVLITISGLQFEVDSENALEIVSRGEYYFRNGKHFLIYEEISEEEQQVSKCVLKLSENVVELTKKGSTNVHLLFEKNKSNMTYYNTPFGELILGVATREINLFVSEDSLDLKLNYTLDMNYQHVSECELTVKTENIVWGLCSNRQFIG